MATRKRPGQFALQALISVVLAAVLVVLPTVALVLLGPKLGALSPFMLYVAAVLVAGLVRGPICGVLVMLAGGAAGYMLCIGADSAAPAGSMTALMLFWIVSAPVLFTANELRVQLGRAMSRLSAAVERSGGVAS